MSDETEALWFHWELPPAERARAVLDVDETMLALDINHGRRLLAVQHSSDPGKELIPAPDLDNQSTDYIAPYADQVSAILQAANYAGVSPVEVCHQAMLRQTEILAAARYEASTRWHGLNDGDTGRGGTGNSD